MVERFGQALDPAPIGFRDAGMNVGTILGSIGETGGKAVLFRLKLGQPLGQSAMPAALLDDAHDLGNGFRCFGQFLAAGLGTGTALAVEPVGFLGIGPHGFRRHLRGHHVVAQPGQDTSLQRLAAYCAGIVAAIAQDMIGAGVTVLPPLGVGPTTAGADHEAGQQVARPVGGIEIAIPGKAPFYPLPRCLDMVQCAQCVLPRLGGIP